MEEVKIFYAGQSFGDGEEGGRERGRVFCGNLIINSPLGLKLMMKKILLRQIPTMV